MYAASFERGKNPWKEMVGALIHCACIKPTGLGTLQWPSIKKIQPASFSTRAADRIQDVKRGTNGGWEEKLAKGYLCTQSGGSPVVSRQTGASMADPCCAGQNPGRRLLLQELVSNKPYV